MIKVDLTPKMWVYHPYKCVEGNILLQEEAELLLRSKEGWVKTPNDFPKKVEPIKKQEELQEEPAIKRRGRPPKDENVPHETLHE